MSRFTQSEQNRYERIVKIQEYYAQGYTQSSIIKLMKMNHNTINRYKQGDPYKLCRFDSSGMKAVNYDDYREDIIEYLHTNMSFTVIYEKVKAAGYNGKLTQIRQYCHKLIDELDIEYNSRKNSNGVTIRKNQKFASHCIKKSDLFQYIWSDNELELHDVIYIIRKYPAVLDIIECVRDFRNIYIEKSADFLKLFINKYSESSIKSIKSFAKGLLLDYDAVKNSVVSHLSNGFVEGNNNKIKFIKRAMYGRAKIDLLRVKVLHCR
jgi:Transposase and inactivated derivatives